MSCLLQRQIKQHARHCQCANTKENLVQQYPQCLFECTALLKTQWLRNVNAYQEDDLRCLLWHLDPVCLEDSST